MPARRAVVLAAALAACGAPRPSLVGAPPLAPTSLATRAELVRTPARYAISPGAAPEPIDVSGGVARVVHGGRRWVVREEDLTDVDPGGPDLDGGAAMPSWSARGDVAYVFWRGREVFGAARFDGPLRSLGRVGAAPRRGVAGLDAMVLSLDGGAALVRSDGSIGPAPQPSLAAFAAVDARFAVALDVLGHARLTADGGETWRATPRELDGAVDVTPVAPFVVARFYDGPDVAIDASGAVRAANDPAVLAARAGEPPLELEPAWPEASELGALLVAGAPLDHGAALIAGAGHVARVDLRTLRVVARAELPGGAPADVCGAMLADDAVLVACRGGDDARVYDLTGAPRLEKLLALGSGGDRFVGVDETGALGFEGACAERAADDRQDHPRFCVRARGGAWTEHAVDEPHARAIGFIPRPGGAAAVVVARAADAILPAERVEQRGALRVVRLALRGPLADAVTFDKNLSAAFVRDRAIDAANVITLWRGERSALPPIVLDAAGEVTSVATPIGLTTFVAGGPTGLATRDDGAVFASIDRGATWTRVAAPPAPLGDPAACGLVGCDLGAFLRVGWGPSREEATARPRRAAAQPAERARDAEPAVRLRCAFDGKADAKRLDRSWSLGAGPPSTPRPEPTARIGDRGAISFTRGTPTDVAARWVAPLDLDARVHTARGISPEPFKRTDLRFGYVLTRTRALEPFVEGAPRAGCAAGVLEELGVVRRGIGCLDGVGVGVEIGGRTWVAYLDVSARALDLDLAGSPTLATSRRADPSDARARVSVAKWALPLALEGRALAAGARRDALVVALVDRDGGAVMSAITAADRAGVAARSTREGAAASIGPSEPLASLAALALGSSPACSGAAPHDEATLALAFTTQIALADDGARDLVALGEGGVAVVRWSSARACLDAIEIGARDLRYEATGGWRRAAVGVHEVVLRGARASAITVENGLEVRQPVRCTLERPRVHR